MVNKVDRANVTNLVHYYYDDKEAAFSSLPRYFGGPLTNEQDKLYKRSKSVAQSPSEWFIRGFSSAYDYDSGRYANFDARMQRDDERYNKFGAYSDRTMPNVPLSIRAGRSEFYGDENFDVCSSNADSPDYFLPKSDKKPSNAVKFLRYTSIRSLKKLVCKLKGKKKFDFTDSSRPTSSLSSKHLNYCDVDVALENPIFNEKSGSFGYRDYDGSRTMNNYKVSTVEKSPYNHGLRYQPISYSLTAQHRTPSNLSGLAVAVTNDETPETNRSDFSRYSKVTLPAFHMATVRPHFSSSPFVNVNSNSTCNNISAPTSANNTTGSTTTSDVFTPALTGITNHGNTCYINAVLQCLSNNDQLAEYFLTNNYLPDLRLGQRNAEKYGSHGHVTKCLADFIHALWFKKYTPEISINFKQTVERYSEQYKGSLQQDAQEFFIWLLDRVHEDLNVGIKRRYKLNKTRNKSEDEIACAAMDKHLEAHSSFISYQFHGLFLSSVTCPICDKQSSQCDPFACVSLPVSQSTKKPLYVVMVFLNRKPRLIRFGLNADITASISEVKQCLSKATDVTVDQIILCEMSISGFVQSFPDHCEISCLNTVKFVYAFETPPVCYTSNVEEVICLLCNQTGEGNCGRRFGAPVAIKVDREISYGDLCRSILLAIRNQLKCNLAIQTLPLNAFRLRIADDYRLLSYIPGDVSLPQYSHAVENVFADRRKSTIPSHLKIMVEWSKEDKERNGELYVDTMYGRNVYDLFAVCNHHGDSPNSGHYTDENVPERCTSRQMFVALPPKQSEKLSTSCETYRDKKLVLDHVISTGDPNFRTNVDIGGFNNRQSENLLPASQNYLTWHNQEESLNTSQISHKIPFDRCYNNEWLKQLICLPQDSRANFLVETDL